MLSQFRFRPLPFAAIFMLAWTVLPAAAGEVARIRADLDGDGKPDVVVVTTSSTANPDRVRVVVKVGRTEYSTEQFALDDDPPALNTLVLDRHRKPRQLLLETFEAGSCVFHILAYAHAKLVSLLSVDTGPDCKPPAPTGAGVLGVPSWQGFWWKNTSYRLAANGLALQAEDAPAYPVLVWVAAAKPLQLSGAECKEQTVAAGSLLELERYAVRKDSYLARASETICGWLPSKPSVTLTR